MVFSQFRSSARDRSRMRFRFFHFASGDVPSDGSTANRQTSAWTTPRCSLGASASTSTNTSTSSSHSLGRSLSPMLQLSSSLDVMGEPRKEPHIPSPSTEHPVIPESEAEPASSPSDGHLAHGMNQAYQDEEYYSMRHQIRLSSGYWLAPGINLDQVVQDIPVVGFVNGFDQPIPSLDGPDIHLTLATVETITRVGEENNWEEMLDMGQVFDLRGPRQGQLNDAYAWIALRGDEENKFVMSRQARNRLVPNWKNLVKDWEEFDESITDACYELRKVSKRVLAEAFYCIRALGTEKAIDVLEGEIEDIVEHQLTDDDPSSKIIEAAQRVLITAASFGEATDELEWLVDRMDLAN